MGALQTDNHEHISLRDPHNAKGAGRVAVALLGAVAAFQVALALGAPWGEATQGGRADTVDGVLTGTYRAFAAASAALLLIAALVVATRAGLRHTHLPVGFIVAATWFIVVFLALNTLTNLTGTHPLERWGMSVISLLTMALTAVVARSHLPAH